jgi:adenosylcobinamide kinase/adenosylcobinamide-phosphate guanylyltransferase
VDRVQDYQQAADVILMDCITLWLSSLLIKWDDDLRILNEVERLLSVLQKRRTSFILVSNEVGMGIVPADALTRRFRDLAGMANQKIAAIADTVVFMVSGIPILLKGTV